MNHRPGWTGPGFPADLDAELRFRPDVLLQNQDQIGVKADAARPR